MRIRNVLLLASVLMIALATSGCQHQLIPDQGEKTVRVWEDEEVYKAILWDTKTLQNHTYPTMESQIQFLLAAAYKEAKEIEGGTRVKIISSDSEGYKIEVLEGPYTRLKAFVPKNNLR